MTAKQFVQSKMPNAKAEKHQTNNMLKKETYWLIREGKNMMYFAEGETEAKAWKNAKSRIEITEQP